MLPTQELPLLNVELSVSPVFNETSDYGRWHIDKK